MKTYKSVMFKLSKLPNIKVIKCKKAFGSVDYNLFKFDFCGNYITLQWNNILGIRQAKKNFC